MTAAPLLAVEFTEGCLWSPVQSWAERPHARLRNLGTAAATAISVSELRFDEACRCRFPAIQSLAAGGSIAPLTVDCYRANAVGSGSPSRHEGFAEAISKAVVRAMLTGVASRGRHWDLRIEYEDAAGRRYASVFRIVVRRLPLELEAVRLAGSRAEDER